MAKFENEIERKGYIAYTVKGDSMMPLIRENQDIVVIKKLTRLPKKRDAVLFKRPSGEYVLHRIVKCSGMGLYRIAGDNRSFSETVPQEWIIGYLCEVIKDDRHITADSKEYKAYVGKVPLHRLKLKLIRYKKALKIKIVKIGRRILK